MPHRSSFVNTGCHKKNEVLCHKKKDLLVFQTRLACSAQVRKSIATPSCKGPLKTTPAVPWDIDEDATPHRFEESTYPIKTDGSGRETGDRQRTRTNGRHTDDTPTCISVGLTEQTGHPTPPARKLSRDASAAESTRPLPPSGELAA